MEEFIDPLLEQNYRQSLEDLETRGLDVIQGRGRVIVRFGTPPRSYSVAATAQTPEGFSITVNRRVWSSLFRTQKRWAMTHELIHAAGRTSANGQVAHDPRGILQEGVPRTVSERKYLKELDIYIERYKRTGKL